MNGLTDGLGNGLADGLVHFFCFLLINRDGRSKEPASVNRLIDGGGCFARFRKSKLIASRKFNLAVINIAILSFLA